jgi:hypothetical protein
MFGGTLQIAIGVALVSALLACRWGCAWTVEFACTAAVGFAF